MMRPVASFSAASTRALTASANTSFSPLLSSLSKPRIINHKSFSSPLTHSYSQFYSSSTPLSTSTPSTPLSTSSSSSSSSSSSVTPSSSNTPQLNFDDVRESFAIKSDWELVRAFLVFKLCGSKVLVKNARSLLNASYKMLGKAITETALKMTFFGHFCAGQSHDEIMVVMKRLEKSGLLSILDYAAEADVPQPRDRTGVFSARTYDYEGESECDANLEIALKSIDAAALKNEGFAAIKVTALGKPELLEHISTILDYTKRLFVAFVEEKSLASGEKHRNPSIPLSSKISREQFFRGLDMLNIPLSVDKREKLFQRMDVDASGSIDFLEWITYLDPRLLGGIQPKNKTEGIPTLSQDDLNKMNAMFSRLEKLAKAASDKKVSLMIDAEQTYFQPAIDHLVLHLQRMYNRDYPVIFNTYQCYLKDSYSRVLLDLERSHREGFIFAAKAVRGAYMIQERKRSKDMNYDDPIQDNIQNTHENYHKIVDVLLEDKIAHIMVASHNEKTVLHVTKRMEELNIPKRGGGVYFGQLLGMCDHVSFSLGRCGYAAYKYVPYGPIHDVLPYLIRRAEENSDMLGGAGKELRLIKSELKRRWTPKFLSNNS